MERKKPNQITIKMNGSAVQPNKEANTLREFTRTTVTHLLEETSKEIPDGFPPQIQEETIILDEKQAESSTEEDALFRLNQLRYQSAINQRSQENLAEFANVNQDDQTQHYLDGPIIDLAGESDHADSPWFERLRTNRSTLRKGITRSLPLFARTSWFRVMASTVGAVALGLVFGFIVLMVFKEEQLSQSYKTVLGETLQIPGKIEQPASTSNGATEQPTTDQTDTPQQSINSEEMIQTIVTLPEQNFFLAQAGVFSDIASAEPAIEPLQKQGYPHFLYEIEGKHHLFVATAPTRDEILGIASYLKNSKMEVYIKELAFPPLNKEMNVPQSLVVTDPITPDSNKVETFLTNGFELTRSLSAYSSNVLNQSGTQQPITTEEETKLRDLHRKFLDESRTVQAGVPKNSQPLFKNMIDGLNQAVTAMTGLKTQNATLYAWQVQNGVFQFVENYVLWSKSSPQ